MLQWRCLDRNSSRQTKNWSVLFAGAWWVLGSGDYRTPNRPLHSRHTSVFSNINDSCILLRWGHSRALVMYLLTWLVLKLKCLPWNRCTVSRYATGKTKTKKNLIVTTVMMREKIEKILQWKWSFVLCNSNVLTDGTQDSSWGHQQIILLLSLESVSNKSLVWSL